MNKGLLMAAILCILTLSACGSGNENTIPVQEESHPVAVAEIYEWELPAPMERIDCHAVSDRWLYLSTRYWNGEEKTLGSRVLQNDIHGEYNPAVRIWDAGTLPLAIVAGRDGECYLFGKFRETDVFFTNVYNEEGKLLRRREYSGAELENKGEKLTDGLATEDGRLYLYAYGSGGTVFSFDPEGNLAEKYTPGLENLEGIAAGRENRVYAYCLTGDDPLFVELSGEGEPLICPLRPGKVFSGYDEGIYLSTGEGFWQYAPETGETHQLWEWDEVYIQLDANELDQVFCGQDGMYLLFYDQMDRASKQREELLMAKVTFQNSLDYPGKQTITLGTIYDFNINSHVEELIHLYNRQSQDYRVELVSFEEPEGSIRSDLVSELELRLMRGEGPDLMELTGMYADTLIAQGAFEDLDAYYQSSGKVKTEDLLRSVQESSSVMGHNVLVIPSFWVSSVVSKQDIPSQDWTPWRYLELAGQKQLFQFPNWGTNLSNCLGVRYGAHFIDYEKKKCYFDSEEFIALLEQCAPLESVTTPLSYSVPALGDADFLMKTTSLHNSEDYLVTEYYEGNIYWVGRPGWEGMENDMYPDEVFAMNSSSSHKDGAWDFLEFLLSEELQRQIDWGFPARRDSFEAYLKSSCHAEDYHAEDFGFSSSSGPWGRELTEKDFSAIRNIADTAVFQTWGSIDNPIRSIVYEEADMFFSGNATARETAKKIQSRVSLYLNEL